jgi:16S rRNA (uracil1498-N3)-methyltransferase
MSERFYVNRPLRPGAAILEGPEAHHLGAVCRIRQGDQIALFNGNGREYRAIVTSVGKRQVEVDVLEESSPARELPFRVTVACPLPKGDRGQWLVEKLTELGATCYVPLETRRSIVHPAEGKTAKLRRAVIEACKQCGRNVLMEVSPLCKWDQLVARTDLAAVRWLADFSGEPFVQSTQPRDIAVAIGPEGGWSEEEVAAARQAGWRIVRLGPRVLRVETAAMAAVALIGQLGAQSSL